MESEDKDIVSKFQPQVSVFFDQNLEVSIEVIEMSGQSEIVSIPLFCARKVAKALNAIAKEYM